MWKFTGGKRFVKVGDVLAVTYGRGLTTLDVVNSSNNMIVAMGYPYILIVDGVDNRMYRVENGKNVHVKSFDTSKIRVNIGSGLVLTSDQDGIFYRNVSSPVMVNDIVHLPNKETYTVVHVDRKILLVNNSNPHDTLVIANTTSYQLVDANVKTITPDFVQWVDE